MIVIMNRIQGQKFPIVYPKWPPKIQDGRHEIKFFDIFAYDFFENDKTQRTKNLIGMF